MKLDSEAQRKLLLKLIGEVPVRTDINGLFGGPPEHIRQLVQAVQQAEIVAKPSSEP